MKFLDNIKAAFAQPSEDALPLYGNTKEWFLSDAGREVLQQIQSTAELTDFVCQYLQCSMANRDLLDEKHLYRLSFVLADAVVNSRQPYAGREYLLNASENPFVAYLQNTHRSLSAKTLCYELIFVLLGAVDPFNPDEWIYNRTRGGYSEEEYQKVAQEHGIIFQELLRSQSPTDPGVRLILCELIWLVGGEEFLEIVN